MNPAQYLFARMRSCRSPSLGDATTPGASSTSAPSKDSSNASARKLKAAMKKQKKKASSSCFCSVGSAQHNYHGDDAVGYGPGYMVVADGVSGTMKASGVLARVLVSETLAVLSKLKKRGRQGPIHAGEFQQSMQLATASARRAARRKGRLDSTLSAVYFDDATRSMFVYTVGDCKCVVVRNGVAVFESDSIIYDFNVPAVVSSNQTINYAADVPIQSFTYEAGDVCLLFSDGVHDNLYVDQVVDCVTPHVHSAELIAKKTVQCATNTFKEYDEYIPFAVSAAIFCREAVEELKKSTTVNADELHTFSQKCAEIQAAQVARAAFDKEKRVRQLAFYSATNLLAFAQKKQGKRDDVSVCAAVLA